MPESCLALSAGECKETQEVGRAGAGVVWTDERRERNQNRAGHRLFAGVAKRCPVSGCEQGSGDQANLLRLRALLALRDLELDALSVFKQLVAVHLDRGEVDEHVRASIDCDESVALLC